MLRRRSMLRLAGGGALASLLAALGRPRRANAATYGALVADPDGILDLPPGFRYHVLDQAGEPMDDGYVVPSLPDGMACFPGPDGTVILVRNHELGTGDGGPYPPGTAPEVAYDAAAMGCVTRVVLDAATFERRASNLLLCGTSKNCAGGPSPWGWLTCEETTIAGHGYVFACDPLATSVQPPRKIAAYGRCRREAACVDPTTNIAYLTEDQHDSALYRFVPDTADEPWVGRLQALRVVGHDQYAMSNLAQGQTLAIAWVDLAEPEPVDDTLRVEAQSKGAAEFDRGEGIAFADGEIFMIATTGGPMLKGQIFRIVDHPQHPTIEALLVADDPAVVDQPDNITVAPWGELFFGEDGADGNYIRGVDKDGQVFDFARNALSSAELSGVCFAPDGRALFVNLYGSGMTLAVTGPFPQIPTPGDEAGADETGGDPEPAGSSDAGDPPTTGPTEPGSDAGSSGAGGSSGPLEVGGAYEELTCACSSRVDPPGTAAVAAITAALVVVAPVGRCAMEAPPTED